MPKESCNQGLAQIEQQEAQLSEGEAQLENARSQLAALQAQYEEAAASGVYSEEDLAALAAQVSAYRNRWTVRQPSWKHPETRSQQQEVNWRVV